MYLSLIQFLITSRTVFITQLSLSFTASNTSLALSTTVFATSLQPDKIFVNSTQLSALKIYLKYTQKYQTLFEMYESVILRYFAFLFVKMFAFAILCAKIDLIDEYVINDREFLL